MHSQHPIPPQNTKHETPPAIATSGSDGNLERVEVGVGAGILGRELRRIAGDVEPLLLMISMVVSNYSLGRRRDGKWMKGGERGGGGRWIFFLRILMT